MGDNSLLIIITLILNMYVCQNVQIKWNGAMSDMFEVCNGIWQGGVISPVLFGIYIDELLLELKRNGTGCFVGPTFPIQIYLVCKFVKFF